MINPRTISTQINLTSNFVLLEYNVAEVAEYNFDLMILQELFRKEGESTA